MDRNTHFWARCHPSNDAFGGSLKERISFRMLHKEDLSPIKYERVCEAEGAPVPWNEIVKGYEYKKGKYVVLTARGRTVR